MIAPPPGIPINFFNADDNYGEFSPYYKQDIIYEGRTYPSAEHLYQSLKFTFEGAPEVNSKMIDSLVAMNPHRAFLLSSYFSGELKPTEDWQEKIYKKANKLKRMGVLSDPNFDSIQTMKKVLQLKFADGLKKVLDSTGDNEIVYSSYTDSFWGVSRSGGENHLGKLLMELRN